jgi:hypothetical protein
MQQCTVAADGDDEIDGGYEIAFGDARGLAERIVAVGLDGSKDADAALPEVLQDLERRLRNRSFSEPSPQAHRLEFTRHDRFLDSGGNPLLACCTLRNGL